MPLAFRAVTATAVRTAMLAPYGFKTSVKQLSKKVLHNLYCYGRTFARVGRVPGAIWWRRVADLSACSSDLCLALCLSVLEPS